jgi:hypothetical protein
MSIADNCMVVNLQIGAWTGQRLDKETTRRVTEEARADSDAVRVNKHLIDKDLLKPVLTAAGAVRAHFYARTLPWKDNGDRLLVRKLYREFIDEHERLVGGFNLEVTKFLDESYASALAKAEFRMGSLFSLDDYPAPITLRHKFYVGLDIDSVTEASDFRVRLETEERDRITARIESATGDRLKRAMLDVWGRLADTLGHFQAKMGSDGIFRDSTIRNVEEIVDLLPALNILDDPDLEQIRQTVKLLISGIDLKQVRTDKVQRSAAAGEAQRIIDEMAGFMKAYGGGQ